MTISRDSYMFPGWMQDYIKAEFQDAFSKRKKRRYPQMVSWNDVIGGGAVLFMCGVGFGAWAWANRVVKGKR